MKIAPIIHAIQKSTTNNYGLDFRLVHTGQHCDENMSSSFFQQFAIPNQI